MTLLSFTSRPGTITWIILATVISFCLAFLHVTRWDPEIRFWKAASEQKLDWVAHLRNTSETPFTICYGGSSTTFGIDANYASEELDYPITNLGLHAGMGIEALTGFALSAATPGNLVVVMLEPSLFRSARLETALGTQLCYSLGRPNLSDWRSEGSASFRLLRDLPSLRPGGSKFSSMIGKAVLGKPMYRYQVSDLERGGLVSTEVRGKLKPGIAIPDDQLSLAGRSFFEALKIAAVKKEIEVAYVLPWAFVSGENLLEVRASRAQLLEQISSIIPVIPEPQMGAHDRREDFADTVQHLSRSGARLRTRELVRALRKWITG